MEFGTQCFFGVDEEKRDHCIAVSVRKRAGKCYCSLRPYAVKVKDRIYHLLFVFSTRYNVL